MAPRQEWFVAATPAEPDPGWRNREHDCRANRIVVSQSLEPFPQVKSEQSPAAALFAQVFVAEADHAAEILPGQISLCEPLFHFYPCGRAIHS